MNPLAPLVVELTRDLSTTRGLAWGYREALQEAVHLLNEYHLRIRRLERRLDARRPTPETR